MFKCCLCGREYENEKAAVKCVNKCGREKFLDGAFQHKETKYSGEETRIKFDFEVESDSIKEDILRIFQELADNGAPPKRIETLRKNLLDSWDNKTDEEKKEELGRVLALKNLF